MESNNRSITWEEIYERIKLLPKGKCYGVPRGGQVVAGVTGNAVDTPEEADYILDDLIDSGRTAEKWKKKYPDKPFLALWNKIEEKDLGWIEFPWEESGEREAEDSVARLLETFGEDVTREGLQDTPKRYVKFFKEFLNPPKWNCTTFERIVGLSKLARTLETYSRRLQNQERITNQVAQFLQEELQPLGVAVVLKAKHMCMEMRGVKKHNTWTTTSKMIGVFRDDSKARNEFMNLIK